MIELAVEILSSGFIGLNPPQATDSLRAVLRCWKWLVWLPALLLPHPLPLWMGDEFPDIFLMGYEFASLFSCEERAKSLCLFKLAPRVIMNSFSLLLRREAPALLWYEFSLESTSPSFNGSPFPPSLRVVL